MSAEYSMFQLVGLQALRALAVAPRAERLARMLSIDFDVSSEDSIDGAVRELAQACEGAKGYAVLELPTAASVEIAQQWNMRAGPSLQILRFFDPFPTSGQPRFVNRLQVGLA